MAKKILMTWGGWEGHDPKETTEIFAEVLSDDGFDVEVSDTLDVLAGLNKTDSASETG